MSTLEYTEAAPSDAGRIARFLGFSDERFLEHEYFGERASQSVFYMALDHGDIVGTQAFVPYDMIVNGTAMLTGRSERTLVSPKYRGQGVFTSLMEHCVKRASEKGQMFYWGAGTGATSAFQRAGFATISGHRQYLIAATGAAAATKRLLSAEHFGSRRSTAIMKAARARDPATLMSVMRLALSPALVGARLPVIALKAFRKSDGLSIVTQTKTGSDINAMYARLRGAQPFFHLAYSQSFHTWALDNGNHKTSWVFAYRGADLVAYACIGLDDPNDAILLDFAALDVSAFGSVLEEVRRVAAENNRAFLLAVCNQLSPQQKALYRSFYAAGFIPLLRTGNSVVRAGTFADAATLNNPAAWYMTDLWGLLYRKPSA